MTLTGGYSKKQNKTNSFKIGSFFFLFLPTTTVRPATFYALFVKPVS